MTWLIYLLGILLVGIVSLAGWRALDHRVDQAAWERLIAAQAGETRTFNASMTAGLPEPAQRYFNFTIAQGTPLYTAVEIDMAGEIGLGSKDATGYRDMEARQILAPMKSRLGFFLHALSIGLALTALLLVAVWMMPPCWTPYLFLALWLMVVIARAPGRLRTERWFPHRWTGWTPFVLILPLGLWSVLLTMQALWGRSPPASAQVHRPRLSRGTWHLSGGEWWGD
ncbi:MAG: DUF6544 family protein [Gammaproteobacteria bacterium]